MLRHQIKYKNRRNSISMFQKKRSKKKNLWQYYDIYGF
jgi:hypothetical protein